MLTPKRAENTTKMNAPCHNFDTLLRRQLLQNKLIISLLFCSKKLEEVIIGDRNAAK